MTSTYDTVSFLSDYGTADEFVGVVHSVIRSIAPEVRVIDVTHQVPAYDVRAGALTLARAAQYLAPGVVVAVVDPGVGTARRSIAVEVGDGASILVGPDNGLLAPAVAMVGGATKAVELTNRAYHLAAPGPTFAGRDIFAPVAAHLCAGVPLLEVGTEIDPAGLMPTMIPLTRSDDEGLEAEALWIDRFGNVQLNVDPDEIADHGDVVRVVAGDLSRAAQRVDTFGELGRGQVGIIVDSYGLVTVVVDRGSAAEELRLEPGDSIRLEAFADGQGAPSGASVNVQLQPRRSP
ncbi:MAG: SAM-dependent chlorinase/fluorinase [Acidimicrobiia bacterium]|nr:SAM-dependent chlorinase/fluorinase [Acidimicrobiia bacterium]